MAYISLHTCQDDLLSSLCEEEEGKEKTISDYITPVLPLHKGATQNKYQVVVLDVKPKKLHTCHPRSPKMIQPPLGISYSFTT